jgi:hypothetical protein
MPHLRGQQQLLSSLLVAGPISEPGFLLVIRCACFCYILLSPEGGGSNFLRSVGEDLNMYILSMLLC